MYKLNKGIDAEATARRLAETDNLKEHNQTVVLLKEKKDLEAQLELSSNESKTFKDALEKAKKAAPGARPVFVVHAETPSAPATGAPREDHHEPVVECLLREGDQLHTAVDVAEIKYEEGSRTVTGTVDVIRTTPPTTTLYSEAFENKKTTAISYIKDVTPTTKLSRWGAGPSIFVGPKGASYGVSVGIPQFELFGLELDPMLGGGVGPGGSQGFATVLGRF